MAKSKGTFVINRAKWLTGEYLVYDKEGNFVDGQQRNSSLRDPMSGLMCCLGQACRQLGIGTKTINSMGEPEDLDKASAISVLKAAGLIQRGRPLNTKTARSLMTINDNSGVTRAQRESKVRTLFKKIGWAVKFTGEYPNYIKLARKHG